jgi:hypothetical protein
MNNQRDIVDESSDESFPASDPPSWTPTSGSGDPHIATEDDGQIQARRVLPVGIQKVIHVENGRGEELCAHLASHGIEAIVSPSAQSEFERVEIPKDVDQDILQAIVDEWEG